MVLSSSRARSYARRSSFEFIRAGRVLDVVVDPSGSYRMGTNGLGAIGLEDGAAAVEDGCSMARSVARPAGRRVAHAGDEVRDGVGVALRLDLCINRASRRYCGDNLIYALASTETRCGAWSSRDVTRA